MIPTILMIGPMNAAIIRIRRSLLSRLSLLVSVAVSEAVLLLVGGLGDMGKACS